MTRTHPFSLYGFALAVTAIYGVAFYIRGLLPTLDQPDLVVVGITLDLTVTVPLLYYLLVVRRKGWPAVTVVPVFLVSLLAASLLLPERHQGLVQVLQYLAIPAEAVLLGFIGVRFYGIVRTVRQHPLSASDDALDALREHLVEVVGSRRVAAVFVSEVGLFYYALFAWRTPATASPKHIPFSYNKRSSYGSVVTGIVVVLIIETIALHVLVQMWSPAAAWVLTALSVYTLLWLVGDVQAARLRPILLTQEALIVRIGLRWTVRVPFEAIAWVRPLEAQPPARRTPGYLEAVLWGTPKYLMALKTPIVAHSLYGIEKKITQLGFAPDDAAAFEEALKQRFTAWRQDGT